MCATLAFYIPINDLDEGSFSNQKIITNFSDQSVEQRC
jgi:hypothetical protein